MMPENRKGVSDNASITFPRINFRRPRKHFTLACSRYVHIEPQKKHSSTQIVTRTLKAGS